MILQIAKDPDRRGSAAVIDIAVPVSKVARNAGKLTATIRITGMRRWNARLRVAVWLLKFAAFIAPIGMQVNFEEDSDD